MRGVDPKPSDSVNGVPSKPSLGGHCKSLPCPSSWLFPCPGNTLNRTWSTKCSLSPSVSPVLDKMFPVSFCLLLLLSPCVPDSSRQLSDSSQTALRQLSDSYRQLQTAPDSSRQSSRQLQTAPDSFRQLQTAPELGTRPKRASSTIDRKSSNPNNVSRENCVDREWRALELSGAL